MMSSLLTDETALNRLMHPTPPLIEIRNLSAGYDGRNVLQHVNLNVYPRDFLGIIGPNGGGKTTLMKCVLGLIKPSEGEIRRQTYRNTSGERKSAREAENAPEGTLTMGYLPQSNSIDRKFPITVEEVILSGLSCQKPLGARFSSVHREKAHETLVRMGLDGLGKKPIGELSGGQRQRALLGRAVVANPELLILDEPNTYIDQRFEAKLYEILAEINKDCAIILVSHDIGTTLQQVKSVACVNHTLDYHPSTEYVTGEWLERHFNCPIELLGHGDLPHRILGHHRH